MNEAGMPVSDQTPALRAGTGSRGLLLATVALLALGVVMVHSAVASVAEPGAWYARRDLRHTGFAAVALLILAVGWRMNYRRLGGRGGVPVLPALLLAAALVCGVLVYIPGIGHEVGGRYRWIRIGPEDYSIGFQPSELIKLSLVIFLAAWLTRETTDLHSFWWTFLPGLGLTLLCVGMVVREDLGTAVLIGTAALAVMFLAGIRWYYLVSPLPLAAGGFWLFIVQDPARWGRIAAMINPWSTHNPSAYHARQSLLAVMTGGYFGKGLGHGMLKRGFLPEGSTDFIFSVFCEEWGLVGAVLLVGLVLVWLASARRVSARAGDPFGRTLAGSLGFVIALQAVLHVAVDLVAAPPTGIGCPFVSAGGTRLWTMAVAASLILSVGARAPAGGFSAESAGVGLTGPEHVSGPAMVSG